jgi:cell division protein FtsB
VAWEKDAGRTEAEKKALAADLTKQQAALKQQMNQTLPQLRAQIQLLTQQRAMIGQQMSGAAYGGRGGVGGYGGYGGGVTTYQTYGQVSQLEAQIAMLQAQGDEMVNTFNAMGNQIQQLTSGARPDTPKAKATGKTAPSPNDAKRKACDDALAAARKLVDETKATYATLAGDADVKASLGAINKKSATTKYTLGPSKKFQDAIKALEQAEAKAASNAPADEPGPAASPKRKARTAKRK